VEDDTQVEEDEDPVPVRARRVGRNAEDGAVEGVTVFEPVSKAGLYRGVVERKMAVSKATELRKESAVQTEIIVSRCLDLIVGYVRNTGDGEIA
jgi:hypothetical protein